jgi:hypothetical protein
MADGAEYLRQLLRFAEMEHPSGELPPPTLRVAGLHSTRRFVSPIHHHNTAMAQSPSRPLSTIAALPIDSAPPPSTSTKGNDHSSPWPSAAGRAS